MSDSPCLICSSNFGGKAQVVGNVPGGVGYECSVCGRYSITDEALTDYLGSPSAETLSHRDRAALAHLCRLSWDRREASQISTEAVKRIQKNSKLPSPSIQLSRLLSRLGDAISETGLPSPIHPPLAPRIGAMDTRRMDRLVAEAVGRGWLIKSPGIAVLGGGGTDVIAKTTYDLSISGWDQYEIEKRGLTAGNYGFLALKFGDADLDPLCKEVIGPSVKARLGYDIVDMRDVARAGLIDNIMREQIRDSAFVIADLTHDNAGAYWEAGYAEGLGKPVIYICEKAKFEEAKTHFDTNHCTTVIWDLADKEAFADLLVATLKRSLNPLVSAKEPAE